MAIRKVARMGHPILRKIARALTAKEILSDSTRRLVADMLETMEEYRGIGIAAPQIHESVAIAIIDYQPLNSQETGAAVPPTVIINPKITVLDETEQEFWEGCLSVPDLRGLVQRPRKVRIDFLDLEAKPQTITVENFLATVFQHELDHLFGVLFVDRIRYEPGKSPISFIEEYHRYHTSDDEGNEEGDEEDDEFEDDDEDDFE